MKAGRVRFEVFRFQPELYGERYGKVLEEANIPSGEFVIEGDLDMSSFSEEGAKWDSEENADDEVILSDDHSEG